MLCTSLALQGKRQVRGLLLRLPPQACGSVVEWEEKSCPTYVVPQSQGSAIKSSKRLLFKSGHNVCARTTRSKTDYVRIGAAPQNVSYPTSMGKPSKEGRGKGSPRDLGWDKRPGGGVVRKKKNNSKTRKEFPGVRQDSSKPGMKVY